jgi:drug/metabolite transporter (DMT)-like permease
MLKVLLLYALCATSFTISKAVLAYSAPIFFVAVRMIIAGILLLGFVYWRKINMKIRAADTALFMAIVFFHIYFAYVFDLWSLQYVSSFKSAFFFNLSPFITAILAYFFLGESMTRNKWLGLTIGFIGFLPMLLRDVPTEEAVGLFLLSTAEFFLLLAVISSCIGWITMSALLKKGYSPYFVNGFGMLIGGVLAMLNSLRTEGVFGTPVSEIWPFVGLTLLIIIACNFIFYNFYGHLLHKYTATFLSFAGFTCPLFAALYGLLFLGEQITWHFIVASIIVSFALYLFYREELKQGYMLKRQS